VVRTEVEEDEEEEEEEAMEKKKIGSGYHITKWTLSLTQPLKTGSMR